MDLTGPINIALAFQLVCKVVILNEHLTNPRMVFPSIVSKQFELHDLVQQAVFGQGVATGVVQLPAQPRAIL